MVFLNKSIDLLVLSVYDSASNLRKGRANSKIMKPPIRTSIGDKPQEERTLVSPTIFLPFSD